jgi:acetoin utilization deacetylase AcuC-like enzyme
MLAIMCGLDSIGERPERMKIVNDQRCVEYGNPNHPERPQRVSRTLKRLREQTEISLNWKVPEPATRADCLRAHAELLLERVSQGVDLDADTRAYPGMVDHAYRAAGAALCALEIARQGEPAFSLMRPPGHHATATRAMGFCYFNNVAIAVLRARADGVARVAALDFDLHHGNGTEAILLNQKGCAYFSIHEYPAYPGTGAESHANAYNHPLPPDSSRAEVREAWQMVLCEVSQFKPDLIAVSAGFDMFKNDPLGRQRLEVEDFHWFGTTIRQLQIPAFSVLEGGYSTELPELVLAYLRGLSQ